MLYSIVIRTRGCTITPPGAWIIFYRGPSPISHYFKKESPPPKKNFQKTKKATLNK